MKEKDVKGNGWVENCLSQCLTEEEKDSPQDQRRSWMGLRSLLWPPPLISNIQAICTRLLEPSFTSFFLRNNTILSRTLPEIWKWKQVCELYSLVYTFSTPKLGVSRMVQWELLRLITDYSEYKTGMAVPRLTAPGPRKLGGLSKVDEEVAGQSCLPQQDEQEGWALGWERTKTWKLHHGSKEFMILDMITYALTETAIDTWKKRKEKGLTLCRDLPWKITLQTWECLGEKRG